MQRNLLLKFRMQHDDVINEAILNMIQETGVVLLSAIDLCVQFAVHHSSSSKMNLYLKSLDVNCNNFDAVVKLT